jgi:hypothetical protein
MVDDSGMEFYVAREVTRYTGIRIVAIQDRYDQTT